MPEIENHAEGQAQDQVQARAGDAQAQIRIGKTRAAEGKLEEGLYWLQQAAHQNSGEAQFELGHLLQDSDPEQAYRWHILARENGHPGAAERAEALSANMDVDAMTRCHQWVKEWQRTHEPTEIEAGEGWTQV